MNGVVIIAHGSSSPKAIKNAIYRAHELSEKKIIQHIQQDIELNLLDVGGGKGTLWKQIKSIAFGGETPEDKEATTGKTTSVDPEPKKNS